MRTCRPSNAWSTPCGGCWSSRSGGKRTSSAVFSRGPRPPSTAIVRETDRRREACGGNVTRSARTTGPIRPAPRVRPCFPEIDYFNADGTLNRVFLQTVEQDTSIANGKSITGEPYTTNVEILLDSTGAITNIDAAGVVEKLALPSGAIFLSAGRIFLQHPGVTFLLSPDVEHSGDVAAFCAALS
jgi:hypothetical protein